MKKSFKQVSYIVLYFFSSVSAAYAAEIVCESDDCLIVAKEEKVTISTAKGIEIVATPFLRFTMDGVAKKITKVSSDLVIEIDDERKIVLSSISSNDLGLSENGLDIYRLFKLIFLKSFNSLENKELTSGELVAIRSFKISANLASADDLIYFSRGGILVITYYDTRSKFFEAYIINKNKPKVGQHISAIGYSNNEFKRLISTIKEH